MLKECRSGTCCRRAVLAATLGAAVVAAGVAAAPAEPAEPSEPAALARVRGNVADRYGAPIGAARVEIFARAEAKEAVASSMTGADGGFSLAVPENERWQIRVGAAGYLAADGLVDTAGEGRDRAVRIQLEPARIEFENRMEGAWPAVSAALDEAERLQRSGDTASAARFVEASRLAPPQFRASILAEAAHRQYLGGRPEAALATLEQALELEFPNPSVERVYRELGGTASADRVERTLSRLAASPRQQPAPNPPQVQELLDRAPEALSSNLRGAVRVRLRKESTRSADGDLLRRAGLQEDAVLRLDPRFRDFTLSQESYQVFVPESYRPGAEGWGLLIWVSPNDFGGVTGEMTRRLLSERRLIWIGADRSGNDRPRWDRFRLALAAAGEVTERLGLDRRRVFLAGYSGGGRVASALLLLYPEVFRGALALFGADWFEVLPRPESPGTSWVPGVIRPSRARLATLRRQSRFVLVSAEFDFNRTQTEHYAQAMRRQRFEQVCYLEIMGGSHFSTLTEPQLRTALEALDGKIEDSKLADAFRVWAVLTDGAPLRVSSCS